MSWLSDRTIVYRYKRPDGGFLHLKQNVSDERPDTIVDEDGTEASYDGFEPEVSKQTNIVTFEKNGRLGVRVRGKNGEIQHISKSKLHYMRTGRIENQYSKDYKAHLEKTKQDQLLRTQQERSKGKASGAVTPQDVLKNLPDGEYVSDGKSFMPAPKKEG